MVKRIMKKLKDLTLSITFAEPNEYDSTKKHAKERSKLQKKSRMKQKSKKKREVR